ncbi:hypothetical protein GCM10020001_008270 [Nonomuraea salmonea]
MAMESRAADPLPGPVPRQPPEPAVEVAGLVKRYGATTAVDGLTFRAERGEVTAVLGPNGAGKTSTVEICEGFRRADGGTVKVLGLAPTRPELRARVGIMPQAGGVPPATRCAEWLRLVARFYARPLDSGALLARLGLTEHARTPFRRLSGGQQQRLSLAAAVIGRPELVFLDEPTAGLDPQARHACWDLVAELRGSGGCRWCSPPTTWTRPSGWPTTSSSSTGAAWSPRAARPR